MAITTRPFTEKELAWLKRHQGGEIERPQWIVDWQKKVDEAERILLGALDQQLLTPEQKTRYTNAFINMKLRTDRLYEIWINELPFKTWDEIAAERPPSEGDLFRYTVEDTEDYLNGPGVSAFAFFLDQRWKGFLKDFAHQCLRDCDPLIEESFPMTQEVRHTLSYPEQAFGSINNREVLESRLLEWVGDRMPKNAPSYVYRLLTANVMVALGKEMVSLTEMEFARCEATEPNFERMMDERNPVGDIYLQQTQRWQIEVLLKMWPSS